MRDLDTEKRVLGDLLLRPEHVLLTGEWGLTTQCFDTPAHQHIWSAISAQRADGLKPDPPMVIAWLKAHQLSDEVRAGYVFELTDGAIALAVENLEHYVRQLVHLMRARSARRRLAQVGAAIREEPERVTEHLAELQRHLEHSDDRGQCHPINDVELLNSPAPAYLIEGTIPADGNVMGYGPPGCGKTFVLPIAQGLSIATGIDWLGKRVVAPGPVMYVAAEGRSGIAKRVAAWKDLHGVARTKNVGFYTWPHAIDLRNPSTLATLIAYCRQLRPRAIYFDTLARCAPGYNEIDGQHCGEIIATCDYLRRTLGGCAIFLIHHTSKNSSDERGHTAFRGAFDCMMSVTTADDLSEINCTKQKDDEPFSTIRFVLRSAPNAESCAAVLATGGPTGSGAGILTANAATALRILEERFPISTGATSGEWQEASGIPRSSFYRVKKCLVDEGHVIIKGPHFRVARTIDHDIARAARLRDA